MNRFHGKTAHPAAALLPLEIDAHWTVSHSGAFINSRFSLCFLRALLFNVLSESVSIRVHPWLTLLPFPFLFSSFPGFLIKKGCYPEKRENRGITALLCVIKRGKG
jgi:hypothetical protein